MGAKTAANTTTPPLLPSPAENHGAVACEFRIGKFEPMLAGTCPEGVSLHFLHDWPYIQSMAEKICTVRQYRPNVERQKWLYSMMQSRAYIRRQQGKPMEEEVLKTKKHIPDNSEPWLPGGVKSVADALWISDQIKKDIKRWRPQ